MDVSIEPRDNAIGCNIPPTIPVDNKALIRVTDAGGFGGQGREGGNDPGLGLGDGYHGNGTP